MAMSELLDLDATGQADLVRKGEVSAKELVQASIDAIERLDPELDIMLHRAFELALENAEGPIDLNAPFCGVPMVVKDIEIHVKGLPFSHGTIPFLRKDPIICDHDSNLAADFRAAGLQFLGRSNCTLQAFFPTHDIEAHTMPRNPWNRDYSTSGSSSGSPASVAARVVAIGHGGDGGGSIRLPASVNGIVGLKPTRGRVSVGPDRTEIFSIGSAWSHEFAMTRTVRDTDTLLKAVEGWRAGDPFRLETPRKPSKKGPLRIGFSTDHFSEMGCPTDPGNALAGEQAAKLLESLGHEVELVKVPKYGFGHFEWLYEGGPGSPHYAGVAYLLDKISKERGIELTEEHVGPQMFAGLQLGRSYSAGQMLDFASALQTHTTHFDNWWAQTGIDVMLTPTVPIPTPPIDVYLPPPHGSYIFDPQNPLGGTLHNTNMIGFTQVFNWTGQPAISLPLYEGENGMPLGIHLAAARQDDEMLIDLAYQLEEALPWADRRPAHCA